MFNRITLYNIFEDVFFLYWKQLPEGVDQNNVSDVVNYFEILLGLETGTVVLVQ